VSAKGVLTLAGCLLAAALLAGVATLWLSRTERGRHFLIAAASRVSGYDIRAASLAISPGLVLRARDFSVAPAGGADFFHAENAVADLSLGSLLRGRAERIEAAGFSVDWSRLPAGGGGSSGARFEELRLANGVVRGLGTTEIAVPQVIFARSAERGEYDVHGELSAAARGARISWSGRADANGERLRVRGRGEIADVEGLVADFAGVGAAAGYVGPFMVRVRARGKVGGEITARIAGRLRSPQLQRRAGLRGTENLDRNWQTAEGHGAVRVPPLAPLRARGSLARTGGATQLKVTGVWRELALAELKTVLTSSPRWLPQRGMLTLDVDAAGTAENPRFAVRISANDVAGADVAAATVTAAFRLDGGVLATVAPGVVLEKLSMKAGANTVSADKMTCNAALRREGDRLTADLTDVAVVGLGARSDDGVLQAVGLKLGGTIATQLADDGTVLVDAKVDAPSGEALYGRIYLDLAGFPAKLAVSVERRNGETRLENVSLDLASVGRIEGAGSLDGALAVRAAKGRIVVPSMSVPFEHLVRESFKDAWPFLGETEASGALAVDLEYARKDASDWRAAGRVALRNGVLAVTDPQVRLQRYDLDVPFSVDTRAAAAEPRNGTVKTGDAEVSGLKIAPVELPLVARTNEISVAQAITVPFAGGSIRIEGLRAYDLAGAAPAVDARVTVEQMQLAEIARAAGSPRDIHGTVGGDLGAVTLTGTSIRSTGALAVDVFGGRVAVTNLGVDEVFSPVPALRLDAEATGIDLRQATEILGVGYVSGVARANVRGGGLAAGQPRRVVAAMETVPTRGVSQRVSVAAIQQLTILGGAEGGAVTSTVLNLFDEYRYAKMGFRCSLQNDRFILHGVAEHDGKDFLVVGTLLPPTVNVISHNEVIAFKEMVRRLSRISTAGEGKVRVQ
jgi:hypothetical protein